jgi:hypothetical protein
MLLVMLLFENRTHAKILALARWSILQHLIWRAGGSRLVRCHDVFERQNMRGRRNLAGISLRDDIDVFQNRRKLLLGMFTLVICQRQSRQHRHVIYGLAINTHIGISYL